MPATLQRHGFSRPDLEGPDLEGPELVDLEQAVGLIDTPDRFKSLARAADR
jgi:hypothetical protein